MAVALGTERVLDVPHYMLGSNSLRRQQDDHCLRLLKCLRDFCGPVVARQKLNIRIPDVQPASAQRRGDLGCQGSVGMGMAQKYSHEAR